MGEKQKMKRTTSLVLAFIFSLFFVIGSYASSSAGRASIFPKTPAGPATVTTGFVIVALSIALSALVFALKDRKDKYEEEY